MSEKKRLFLTGFCLIGLSAALHTLHYFIFGSWHHIFLYLLGDIAFIPLEIFIVSVVIERLLEKREHEKLMKKMHMLIGLYFQEIGLDLLKRLVYADNNRSDLQKPCHIDQNWKSKDFHHLEEWLANRPLEIQPETIDFDALYLVLSAHKELMINLISNPTLLEHESFSDLLLAVNHLRDEMALRERLKNEPHYKTDFRHYKHDLERVYRLSCVQWIRYIEHLQAQYPFLYNAARVTNPFEERHLEEVYKHVRTD